MKYLKILALCAPLTLAACGTGTNALPADGSASTPATSHFKADLASGYYLIDGARVAATAAVKANPAFADKAAAIQNQCKAFTATLDTIRAAGETSTTSSTLTTTVAAITAFSALVATETKQ